MLTLTFLGVGSAFAKRNFQSNALIEAWSSAPGKQAAPDDVLLIDFGSTAPLALHSLKQRDEFGYLDAGGAINYPALRRVFITHLHADHVGGLEEMAAMNYYYFGALRGQSLRPELISSRVIVRDLWEHCLRGGLETGHGQHRTLGDYFNERALKDADQNQPALSLLHRYHFRPFSTDHLRLERKHDWPSLGLLMSDAGSGRTVFYSGDTRFDPAAYSTMWERASIIFHEVQLIEEAQPVHTLLSELRGLPAPIRRKMILYHYGDEWDHDIFTFVGQEFAGFARPQTRYVLFE